MGLGDDMVEALERERCAKIAEEHTGGTEECCGEHVCNCPGKAIARKIRQDPGIAEKVTSTTSPAKQFTVGPPLVPGTRVKTISEKLRPDLFHPDVRSSRKWGVTGTVLKHHEAYGLSYDVRHDDGTESSYDATEIQVIDSNLNRVVTVPKIPDPKDVPQDRNPIWLWLLLGIVGFLTGWMGFIIGRLMR